MGSREVYYHHGTAIDRICVMLAAGKKVTSYRDKLDGRACWIVEWS